jgi:bacteriocin-like protein
MKQNDEHKAKIECAQSDGKVQSISGHVKDRAENTEFELDDNELDNVSGGIRHIPIVR